MSTINWSWFITRININAPVEKLYRAWATRSGIESWFLRISEFKDSAGILRKPDEPVETGDSYKWLWYGWPDEMVEYGTILDQNGKDKISFSFGKAGNCKVTIKQEEGENIVQLLQEDIPSGEEGKFNWHVGCKTGWTFYLANMKSILEGGIDLRNRNVKLQQVINS